MTPDDKPLALVNVLALARRGGHWYRHGEQPPQNLDDCHQLGWYRQVDEPACGTPDHDGHVCDRPVGHPTTWAGEPAGHRQVIDNARGELHRWPGDDQTLPMRRDGW